MRLKTLLVILAVSVMTTAAVAQSGKPEYPTKDEVLSALQSAEMAVNMYEQDVQSVELILGEKLEKDHEVIRGVRQLIQGVRRDPEAKFTSAVALLLVTNLDDAGRNDLLNATQLLTRVVGRLSTDASKSVSDLRMVQAIQRTDQLLYVASNQLFTLGVKRADADEAVVNQAVAALNQCMAVLKKQAK